MPRRRGSVFFDVLFNLRAVGKLCGNFNRLRGEPFFKCFEREAIFDADVANSCAPERRHMRPALQCFADVADQRSNVSTFSADDVKSCVIGQTQFEDINLFNANGLGCELHVPTFAGQIVGAVAINLAGRKNRRHLQDIALKLSDGFLKAFCRDMCRWEGFIYRMFKIEAGRRLAEF